MAQLVPVAELLTAVFQGKELSPGQFFPPTRKRGRTVTGSLGLLESPFPQKWDFLRSVAGPAKPGGTPMPGNISGPSQTRAGEPYIRPLGGEGFWEGDYGGGVRVGRHFGARWLVP